MPIAQSILLLSVSSGSDRVQVYTIIVIIRTAHHKGTTLINYVGVVSTFDSLGTALSTVKWCSYFSDYSGKIVKGYIIS